MGTAVTDVIKSVFSDGSSSSPDQVNKPRVRQEVGPTIDAELDSIRSLATNGARPKGAVRAGSLTNVTMASIINGASFGGVTLATGNRIAFMGQSSGATNGIYVVQASANPVRATDADTSDEALGMSFYVEDGTLAGKSYVCSNVSLTLGTTPLTFALSSDTASLNSEIADLQDETASVTDEVVTARGGEADLNGRLLNIEGQISDFAPETGYEVELCGYTEAVIDDGSVIISSIDENGQTIGVAGFGALESEVVASRPIAGYEVELCGYRYVEIDDYLVILSSLSDQGVSYPAANDNAAAEYIESAAAQAYTFPDGLLRELYIQPSDTTVLRLVTDVGRPRNVSLGISSVIWASDDVDAPHGLWHQPIAGGAIAPVLPMASIFVLGDSLTAGAGASTIPLRWRSLLAASTGLPVVNGGVGGQTSKEIAARFDATRALFTVTGNSIPASGSVALTAWNTTPLTDQGPGPLFGWLAGIYGKIEAGGYDGNGDPTSLTFTRSTAGSTTACPAGSEWVADVGVDDRRIGILWMGRNNPTATSQILADYAACYARFRPLVKRILVISNVNGESQGTGTSIHTAMQTVNAALASTYGSAYVDVQAALVAAYDPGQPQDVSDHANDIVPASLRADATHHNDAGQQVVHDTILAKLTSLNWLGDLAA